MNSEATHTHTTTTRGRGQPRNGFSLGTAMMTRFWMDGICGFRRLSARGLQEALDKKYNEGSSRSASANHEPRGPDDEVSVQSKSGAARKGRREAGLWARTGRRHWLALLPTEPLRQAANHACCCRARVLLVLDKVRGGNAQEETPTRKKRALRLQETIAGA